LLERSQRDRSDAGFDGAIDAGLTLTDAGPSCGPLGCSGIDILFVVDNSISMGSAQANLAAAFPQFLSDIQTQLAGTDAHLLVVDTDATGYEHTCERLCPSMPPGSVLGADQGVCAHYRCGSLAERSICDSTLGGGSVYPIGTSASNRDCDFPEGRRFLQSGDEDLEERFLCSAAVGIYGDGNERPIGAMLSALEVETAEGGCVEGFLREDALLVVILISDAGSTAAELDSSSVAEWRRRLLALKCGREEGVVVVTVTHDGSETAPWYASLFGFEGPLEYQWQEYCFLSPSDPCCCPGEPLFPDGPPGRAGACPECASEPPPWQQCWFYFTGYGLPLSRFSNSFGVRGLHREICSDFSDVLSEALSVIDNACDLI
jgi:hypothetical protein